VGACGVFSIFRIDTGRASAPIWLAVRIEMENLNLEIQCADEDANWPATISGDLEALVRLRDAIDVLLAKPGSLHSIGLPTSEYEVRVELKEA
jgi:hypothetical protein